MTPRLHVLLGAGGVGKTTLAAGYALALARRPGGRVGLLGIDPSRRLKDALSVPLTDELLAVPTEGVLHASLLEPEASVRRWAKEACEDEARLARLFANPFFSAMADRLATATDIFAAVRIAEWAEADPALTDLVVDTAPGLNAIEFLTRPQRLAAFMDGRLLRWLRLLARGRGPEGRGPSGWLRGGAQRVLGGLVRMGGMRLVEELADFFSLIEAMFARMLPRLERTRKWLASGSTEILVVTTVRADGHETAESLVNALGGAGLTPRAIIVNRAFPASFVESKAALTAAMATDPSLAPFIRYAFAHAAIEKRVTDEVRRLSEATIILPDADGLDGDGRLAALRALGDALVERLGALRRPRGL